MLTVSFSIVSVGPLGLPLTSTRLRQLARYVAARQPVLAGGHCAEADVGDGDDDDDVVDALVDRPLPPAAVSARAPSSDASSHRCERTCARTARTRTVSPPCAS